MLKSNTHFVTVVVIPLVTRLNPRRNQRIWCLAMRTVLCCISCTLSFSSCVVAVYIVEFHCYRRKHGIHGTSSSNQGETCDTVPLHSDLRSLNSKRKIQQGQQKTRKINHITLGVSMCGKYHQYKEKWCMYKSPVIAMNWSPQMGVGVLACLKSLNNKHANKTAPTQYITYRA